MYDNWQERTRLLLGEKKCDRLAHAAVAVVGTGGVGAYAAEMLCRAGIGRLTLIDADRIAPSNINRQLPALHSLVGRPKVEVLAARFLDINPSLRLDARTDYLTPEKVPALLDEDYDFIVDAIDTIAPKCALLSEALRRHLAIVSSMGAGGKTDITQIRQDDLWRTYHCGLAKAVRHNLARTGLRGHKLPVVFSTEQANRAAVITVEGERNKKTTAGTVSYMPATFGCFLAAYVLRKL